MRGVRRASLLVLGLGLLVAAGVWALLPGAEGAGQAAVRRGTARRAPAARDGPSVTGPGVGVRAERAPRRPLDPAAPAEDAARLEEAAVPVRGLGPDELRGVRVVFAEDGRPAPGATVYVFDSAWGDVVALERRWPPHPRPG